jgi:echinoid protein
MGDSDYSEEVTATTKLDRFPVPQRVSYDPSNGQVAINLASSCLQLVALVELRDEVGEWRTFTKVPVGGTTHKELTVPISPGNPATASPSQSPAALELEDYVRVKLCLQGSQDPLCGAYIKADSEYLHAFKFFLNKFQLYIKYFK